MYIIKKHIHFLLKHSNYILTLSVAFCLYSDRAFSNGFPLVISVLILFLTNVFWAPIVYRYYLDQDKNNLRELRKCSYLKMVLGWSIILFLNLDHFGYDLQINLLYGIYIIIIAFTFYKIDKKLYQKYNENISRHLTL